MSAVQVQDLIRPEVRELTAYHVADATGLIKLDAMENPHPLPPEVDAAWRRALAGAELNRYPDPRGRALKSALRERFGIAPEYELLLGNGSDELIQILAMAVAGSERTLLAPEPGFVMYRMIARFVGMRYRGVALAEPDFALDEPAMAAAMAEDAPVLTFIAYPNNPTGNCFDPAAMERLIEAAPGLVVVDEAYSPYTDDTFLHRLGRFPNLLVMRTLSKLGLAGLRLGFLVGRSEWIRELEKLRLPYNIGVLTQLSARFLLEHGGMFDSQTAAIRGERTRLLERLGELPGLTVYPSRANFVLFRAPPGRGRGLFDGLLRRGVLVKYLGGGGGVLADCLRVTVGTANENSAFLVALAAELGREGARLDPVIGDI